MNISVILIILNEDSEYCNIVFFFIFKKGLQVLIAVKYMLTSKMNVKSYENMPPYQNK